VTWTGDGCTPDKLCRVSLELLQVTPVLRIFDVPLALSFYVDLLEELHSKGYRFMNPGLDDGPGEHMLSTELIDPFGNLIRFFERNAA
jgi:Glyoxalase superfamily protein